jgi:hypothetical protein
MSIPHLSNADNVGIILALSTGGKVACAVGAAIGAIASISTFIIGNIGLSAAETAYVTGQSFLELTRRYDEDTNSTDLSPRVRNIIQGYRRNPTMVHLLCTTIL